MFFLRAFTLNPSTDASGMYSSGKTFFLEATCQRKININSQWGPPFISLFSLRWWLDGEMATEGFSLSLSDRTLFIGVLSESLVTQFFLSKRILF